MANIIKIKRSTTTNTPVSLAYGELGWSDEATGNGIGELFIGTNAGGVAKIGSDEFLEDGDFSANGIMRRTAAGTYTTDLTLDATTYIDGGNWKTFYTNGTGVLVELALGASGEVLTANGATSAPSWQTAAGNVTKVGTPVNNEMAVWTGDGTLEGEATAIYNSVASTTDQMTITANAALTSGSVLKVIGDLAALDAGDLVDLIVDNVGSTSNVLRLQQDGTGDILTAFDGASEAFTINQLGKIDYYGGAATTTNRQALISDGTDIELRLLVEADISDLGTYLTDITGETLSDLSDIPAEPTGGSSNYFLNYADTGDTFSWVAQNDAFNYAIGTGAGTVAEGNHTHLLAAGATDVTATAAEVNLLDLSGLTAGWALIADTATTASWQAITESDISDLGTYAENLPDLGDVTITGSAANELLFTTGANTWVNYTLAEAGIVAVADTDASTFGFVVDEDDMVSNSATKVPTQQSVKAYVDANIQGFNVKDSVRVATAASLPAYTQAGAGAGATITMDATGVVTIDGEDITAANGYAVGDRILVQGDGSAAAADEGIYEVTTLSLIGVAMVLTRTVDADTTSKLLSAYVFVDEGTTYGDTSWLQTADIATVDTTAQVWSQFTSATEHTIANVGTGADVWRDRVGNVDNLRGILAVTNGGITAVVNSDNIDVSLDINGLVTDSTSTGSADFVPYYDTGEGAENKILIDDLLDGGTF